MATSLRFPVQLHTLAKVTVPRPIEQVFDFAVDAANFCRIMKPSAPVPGVARSELIGADQPKTGAKRKVVMTDDSVVLEELLEVTRPHRHRYRWLNRPAFPFSLLVRGAEARWTFERAGADTEVEWHYTFELTSPLAYPAARLVVFSMQRWMANALAGLREIMKSG